MGPDNNPAPSGASKPETSAPKMSSFQVQPTTPPEPTTSPEPQSEPKPAKSSKPVIWCLAILAIIGIVTAVVFAYLYFTTPAAPTPAPNNNQSSTTPDEPTTTEETEITDTLLKKDLDEKIAILHDVTETGPFFITKGLGRGYDKVFPLYNGEDLSDIAKLVNVANSLNQDYILSKDIKQAVIAERGFDEEYAKIFMEEYNTGIKGETLATKYYDVFGETPNKEAINDPTYCPYIFYNSSYDFYYLTYECGGTGPDDGLYYKNKYTTDNNHAYVYISTGTFTDPKVYCEPITTSDNETDNSPVCADLTNSEGYGIGDFKIDQSNYQDFAQYRFVFNKADDGTYYFSKVEKL